VKWHRLAGKFYIGGSIISALMVFYLLSNYPLPGAVPSLGFLAVIWLFTTMAAFWFALKKNFKLHKEFMIRSYVCSLAFVFIRILPFVNEYTGLFNFIENDEMKWTIYEWICWVYPLLITEFLLSWWPSIIKLRTAGK
jgi:Na+/melibiose symporter-like transporter